MVPGPYVLVEIPGKNVAHQIREFEEQTQKVELKRSVGPNGVDPVVLQAIMCMFSPDDPTLWIPREKHHIVSAGPLNMDERLYAKCDCCGYRSLKDGPKAVLGYVPANQASVGPFLVGLVCTHMLGVSIVFDVRRLTHTDKDGKVCLVPELKQFLESDKYLWILAAGDIWLVNMNSLSSGMTPNLTLSD